ncbi:MAG TPA: hypothetical protein VGP72_23890 [Planctomycetota bacterium]|jgi:hypothetical protein
MKKKQRDEIIRLLDATAIGRVPAGHGAFGAAHVAHVVQTQLSSQVRRTTSPRASVPINVKTAEKLEKLARRASTQRHKVSPTQIAAALLEQAVKERCG